MGSLGKTLIAVGIIIALMGVLLVLAPKTPSLGKLPGDLVWRKGDLTVYFPVTTSLIVSLVLSFILWLVSRR